MRWFDIVILISEIVTVIGCCFIIFYTVEAWVEYRAWIRYHNNNPWGHK